MNPDVQARLERLKSTPIDGQVLKKLVEAGLTWLRANQQMVNLLNVFPVPDGDTGTNMVLTMQSAYNEINQLGHHGVGQMAAAVSQGALMGARGNSGVILSQFWRGFARALHNQEYLDGPALVRAFAEARDTAYKGVVRPVEGTILTVAKDIAAAAAEKPCGRQMIPIEILARVVPAADASVQRTPGPSSGSQAGRGGRLGWQRLVFHPGRDAALCPWRAAGYPYCNRPTAFSHESGEHDG